MKSYSSYKDSRIEWIGKPPSGWNIVQLKYLTSPRHQLSETGEEELLSVTEQRGIVRRRELRTSEEHLTRSDSLVGYRTVKIGDLVNNIMLVWKRGLGVSDFDGIVSPAYSVFSFSKECDPKYYHYLLRSEEYIAEFRRNSTGIIMSRLRLYDDAFGSVYAHCPPLPEQSAIANYLDEKTTQIDSLIEKIERKIELLKEQRTALINQAVTKGLDPNVEMKDSGVEWIGMIPKHWEKSSLKYIIQTLTDYTANGSFKSLADNVEYLNVGFSRLVRLTDLRVSFANQGIYVSEESHKFLSKSELFGGEMLIANVGANTGFCIKMPEGMGKSTLGPNMYLIRNNNTKSETDFVVYLINSKMFQEQLKLVITSTAQPKINKDNLKNNLISLPPLKEQQQILEFLDEKTTQIDSIIEKETKRIELLKEYRQSLISNVVTGKVRVVEDQIYSG